MHFRAKGQLETSAPRAVVAGARIHQYQGFLRLIDVQWIHTKKHH
jgi:hypothetical protein